MIDLHAIKPRTSVNLLVISVKIPVSLRVKLTELGQGGHRGRGSRDRQTQGGHVPRCVVLAQGTWYTKRAWCQCAIRETMNHS